MPYLKLPLTINTAGHFEYEIDEEKLIKSRLALFFYSGRGDYSNFPYHYIRLVWDKVREHGRDSFLCDYLDLNVKKDLEKKIRDEANNWLGKRDFVKEVQLTGVEKEKQPNGLSFKTNKKVYRFEVEYKEPGFGRYAGMRSSFDIKESIHDL